MTNVEIGMGKSARQGYNLNQLALVPSRRTRDADLVDLSWQIDAYQFELPFMSSAMDSVTSPATAIEIGRLGGLGILDLEGLWTRHEDAGQKLAALADCDVPQALAKLTQWYQEPVDPELVKLRIKEITAAGVLAAGSVSPKRLVQLSDVLLKAELDLLVIQGTVISAEHVSARPEPLNLKEFVRQLETPVVVGGCASYPAALHLMRTGAAGVLVGIDGGQAATSGNVTGLGSPLATAIADVRAARMRHLDETGVYVHVIADGGLRTGGDIAKAIACGADAVMLGSAIAASSESPGDRFHWGRSTLHPSLPQGRIVEVGNAQSLAQTLLGPAIGSDGSTNIFGALRQSMAALGYETVKELQKAELILRAGS